MRVKKKLETEGRSASDQIHALERLVRQIDAVRNPFFGLMVLVLLWVPQFAMAVEAWRQRCGPHIGDLDRSSGRIRSSLLVSPALPMSAPKPFSPNYSANPLRASKPTRCCTR